jgi:phospho-N-acetylmuramoyl-pentapeptide-transferase
MEHTIVMEGATRLIPWLLRLLNSTHAVSWGPLRLANSYFFLATGGFIDSVIATWLLLPRFWGELNIDHGRAHAVEAHWSVGKPLSAGLIFISIFIVMALLFVPFGSISLRVLPLLLASMVLGYYDDKVGGFHE